MVDIAATQAQSKGASPSISRKEGQTKDATVKPLNVLSPTPPPPTPLPSIGWTSYTTSRWRFTQSPPRNWQSAPAGVGLT
jgi:hypothetical protein